MILNKKQPSNYCTAQYLYTTTHYTTLHYTTLQDVPYNTPQTPPLATTEPPAVSVTVANNRPTSTFFTLPISTPQFPQTPASPNSNNKHPVDTTKSRRKLLLFLVNNLEDLRITLRNVFSRHILPKPPYNHRRHLLDHNIYLFLRLHLTLQIRVRYTFRFTLR
jgi:hypothetical protein